MKINYYYLILFISCNIFSQNPISLDLASGEALCSPGSCTNVYASYTQVKETSSYQVQSIPFNPPFAYTGGTRVVNPSITDDYWSQLINLPFNFCFYGNFYNQIMIGTNGVIHFPDGSQNPSGQCPWENGGVIPSVATPVKNAIYAVYQDTNMNTPPLTNPNLQNVNYLIFGVYPNRALVINFSEQPLFHCNSTIGLQTSQVVLYETSNKIDVFVKNRSACTTWNGGKGLLGIQNSAGTLALTPPGRNTGAWTAVNEGWSFRPDGSSTSTIEWSVNGVSVPSALNQNVFNVCPSDGDEIQAKVTYDNCMGSQIILSKSIVLNYDQELVNLGQPVDLLACSANYEPVVFDLTQNNSVILNGIDPNNAEIKYFTSSDDAASNINPILNPQNFSSSGQIIYVLVESYISGCYSQKQFELVVNPRPQAPLGDALQSFIGGQTLADIEVIGTNIQWYGSANGNDILPIATLLVDGTTYYASQTNAFNCESRLALPQRLAVTVQQSLSNDAFDLNGFKAYPNPVKDIFRISYVKEISSVAVYNLLGQEILNTKVNALSSDINLTSLSRGAYLVKVTVDGLTNTIKVIKE